MEGVIELRRLLEASGLQSESASRIRALGGGSQQSGTWARLWRVEIRQAAHGPTAKESRDLGLIPLLGKLGGVAKSVELVSRQPLAHQPKMSQNVTRPDSQDSQSPLFCDTRGANPLHFPIEFQLHRVQSMFNAAFVCMYLLGHPSRATHTIRTWILFLPSKITLLVSLGLLCWSGALPLSQIKAPTVCRPHLNGSVLHPETPSNGPLR